MGLSSFKDIPLAEAREEARKMGRIARCEKRDPIEMRKAERSEAAADQARSITFRQCATEFIEDFRKRWTNETHAGQWVSVLCRLPCIAKLVGVKCCA
jgi:hypothetical protein